MSDILFKKGKLYFDTYQIGICHIKFNDVLYYNKNLFYKFSHHLDPACELQMELALVGQLCRLI